jgi:L-threonylcarbamoyladenylate synthase
VSYVTNRLDDEVIKLLKNGGVGFMPSDTIYGISCQALNEDAVERIYKLKYRFTDKPFIVLISSINQASLLKVPPAQMEQVKNYWPGALTLICDAPATPDWLQRGTKTLALRVPGDRALRQLIKTVGPIVSTSANLQARRPANSLAEAQNYFGDRLDFYVDVGPLAGQASTLVRPTAHGFEIIRQGTVKIRQKE